MIEDFKSIELPSVLQELGGEIEKMALLEKEYLEIVNSKIDEFIETSKINLRKKPISSTIIACTDGMFIIREANKHNTGSISISPFPGNVQEARKEYNLKKFEHIKISNKAEFYSLDHLTYDQINNYDFQTEAIKDFQNLISNDNLIEDNYIRTVADVVELGVNQDFERGQFIFRGQINDEWELIPKLLRDNNVDADFDEFVLCSILLSGEKSPYLNTYDPIDLLMNLQHFGIPTRLLDWTSDLLIALFFACYDEKEEFGHKDGNLYAIERYRFTPYKINSSENNSLKQPISKEDYLIQFKKRLDINDIHVFEPVIKNPRMRIQDGCFMFFPLVPLNSNDNKYVNLNEYLTAKNKYIEEENEKNQEKIPKIPIRNKKVDKNFKKSILNELNEKHGISKQSLFVEIDHIERVSKYYLDLYERAKQKALLFKTKKDNNDC
jgi:hypothetical protein